MIGCLKQIVYKYIGVYVDDSVKDPETAMKALQEAHKTKLKCISKIMGDFEMMFGSKEVNL
jgi:hypothetical protein